MRTAHSNTLDVGPLFCCSALANQNVKNGPVSTSGGAPSKRDSHVSAGWASTALPQVLEINLAEKLMTSL